MKTSFTGRRTRFGRLSLLLIITVLLAVILFNVTFTSLANRFGWYINMGRTGSYRLSEDCRQVLDGVIREADSRRAQAGEQPFAVTILFCKEENALAKDEYLAPVYRMALELREAFPDTVTVRYADIIRNPSAVEKYRGEDQSVSIPDYSVILDAGERFSILSREDFYELSAEDYQTTKGFSGNSRFATAISTLASDRTKLACLTSSHGETFSDFEIKHLLLDAGYYVSTVDLRTENIPEECTLLLTCAPKSDLLVAEDVSDVSEVGKIGEFLDRGGNYLVFVEPDTESLPNLEALLCDWGIVGDTFTVTATDGTSETYRYMIRNEGASVTAGGYSISASRPRNAVTDRVFSTLGSSTRVLFKDTTSFSPADGWAVSEDGAVFTDGSRTAVALFCASDGSEAYAAGRRVKDAGLFPLMVYSKDSASGGSVTVCGTTEMLSGAYLQSAVLGNRQSLLCLFNEYDGDVVLGINYTTWPSTRIETLTTAEMRTLTILLTAIPAVCVTLAGCIVLIRRKREG